MNSSSRVMFEYELPWDECVRTKRPPQETTEFKDGLLYKVL
jgi:hypothetical protein